MQYQGKDLNVFLTARERIQYNRNPSIRYFYNNDTYNFVKVDIKNKDLKKLKVNKVPKDLDLNDQDENFVNVNAGKPLLKTLGLNRLNTKKIINNQMINNIQISNELNKNKTVNLSVTVEYGVRVSAGWVTRVKNYQYFGVFDWKYIDNYVNAQAKNYIDGFALHFDDIHFQFKNVKDDGKITTRKAMNYKKGVEVSYQVTNTLQPDKPLEFKQNGKMKAIDYFDIKDIVSNVDDSYHIDENCVRDYLRSLYNKGTHKDISSKVIFNLGNKDGVTPNELKDFCIKYDIKLMLFDKEGKSIIEHEPVKNSKRKSIIGLYYNDHFYAIKNKYLSKPVKKTKYELVSQEDMNINFKKLLKSKIIPGDILVTDIKKQVFNVRRYVHDDIIYVCNTHYDDMKTILSCFGIQSKIAYYDNVYSTFHKIESISDTYLKSLSFMPHKTKKTAPIYLNNRDDIMSLLKNNMLMGIDKNKAYPYALFELPRLIVCDYKTAVIKKITDTDITLENYFLYIAKPKTPCLLMRNQDIYPGYHLKFCKDEGIEFDVIEEIECTNVENHFAPIIEKLFESGVHHSIIKEMLVRIIGTFECGTKLSGQGSEFIEIDKICTELERNQDAYSSDYVDYEGLHLHYKSKQSTEKLLYVQNRRPIRWQLMDHLNCLMYKKMQELKIDINDVIRINTDEIIFIKNKTTSTQKFLKTLNETDWKGWKLVKKEKIPTNFNEFEMKPLFVEPDHHIDDSCTSFFMEADNNNTLFDCYAGCGKTTYIIDKLIPSLNKDDFIVMTPSHSSLKTYREKNINCSVIQKYEYSEGVPTENHIIIDELGLCSKKANMLLYTWSKLGKTIYSFGDFKQLLPVCENKHCDSNQFLKMMYSNIKNLKTNYRNDFTIDYYNQLINEELNLISEVKKICSNSFKEASIILCRTNIECDEYNTKILKHLDIEFGDIGCKIVCMSNDLREKNIYNGFSFTIEDVDGEDVILENDLKITKKQLIKYFKPAYALTFYKAQGQQYESIFIPTTSRQNLSGREAYTLISRIKTKNNKYVKKVKATNDILFKVKLF